MNKQFELFINGHTIDVNRLAQKYEKTMLDGFSEQGKRALAFCAKWLSGEQVFQVNTSGSTGAPKCLTISREQMATSAKMTAQALELSAGDTALACLSCLHIAGLMMLVRALQLGLRLFVVEPTSNPLAEFLKYSSDFIDFTAMVPLQMHTILATGRQQEIATLNTMKAILVGGGPVLPALEQKIGRLSAPVFHSFGMTETVSHIALRRLNGEFHSQAYNVLPGVEIGCDRRGCLKIRAAVTNGNWLSTNDQVKITSPGQFIWLGRIDNVINSGGVKVHAEKVERAIASALLATGLLNPPDYFAAGLPDDKSGEKVVVIFKGLALSAQTEKSLLENISKNLTKYELPGEFIYLPVFCRTGNGKINRRATLAKLSCLE